MSATAVPSTRSPDDCVGVEDGRHMLGGISAETLKRMARSGEIPHVKIKGRTMFKVRDLHTYINEHRVA